jgi:hypothetical protein
MRISALREVAAPRLQAENPRSVQPDFIELWLAYTVRDPNEVTGIA